MTQLANFDPINAERSLRQAIEADPDSPLLHWQLSQLLFSNSYSIQAKSEATKAFDLRTSLSESEQWDIEAWRFYVSKEFPQAAETYARLAAEFPNEKRYAKSLALSLSGEGKQADAVKVIEEAYRGNEDTDVELLLDESGMQPNFDKAAEVSARAAELARQKGFRPLYAHALLREANFLIHQNRLEEAARFAPPLLPFVARPKTRDAFPGLCEKMATPPS
jgi:tetratricopeptide (TPR) repeat protein